MELRTALSSAVLAPPQTPVFATAGGRALVGTQVVPPPTPAVVPLPWQVRTLPATRGTPLAAPYVVPPMVPATCVPWPCQSVLWPPAKCAPQRARPPEPLW